MTVPIAPITYPTTGRHQNDAGHINDHNQLYILLEQVREALNGLAANTLPAPLVSQVGILSSQIATAAQVGHIHSESEVQGLIGALTALQTSLASVVKSVNNTGPDAAGNVAISLPTGTVKTVNGLSPDGSGNVTTPQGTVKTVNSAAPDGAGNVTTPQGTVKSVNSTTPDGSGNVSINLTNGTVTTVDGNAPNGSGAVASNPPFTARPPYHVHDKLYRPNPIWWDTTWDGASITMTPGQDYIFHVTTDFFPVLPEMAGSAAMWRSLGQDSSGNSGLVRDAHGDSLPYYTTLEIGLEMRLTFLMDGTSGGHRFNVLDGTNQGTNPFTSDNPNGYLPGFSSTRTNGTPYLMYTYLLRWLGFPFGWVVVSYANDLYPRFKLMEGGPSYVRAAYTNGTFSATPPSSVTTWLTSIGTYMPTSLRKALYLKGCVFELTDGQYSHACWGGTGATEGLTLYRPPIPGVFYGATTDSANGFIVPSHEFGHAVDINLFRDTGFTVTIPDNNAYYQLQKSAGSYFDGSSSGTSYSNKSGQSLTVYTCEDDPNLQVIWRACIASFNGGATSGINTYFLSGVGGQTTVPSDGNGQTGLKEFVAQMIAGFYYSRSAASDSQLLRIGPAAQVTAMKNWCNTNLANYLT